MSRRYVAAIDQGTTSSRCILFDESGQPAAMAQQEHRQIFPRPGWVEHDPLEIWERIQHVVRAALEKAGAKPGDVAAVGIANQRETAVVWDRTTGQPLHNAIVWQDTRTAELCDELARGDSAGQDRFRATTGLPLSTYFSGPKLAWMLRNVPAVREAADAGRAAFGTIDSWIIWNLTGGPRSDGGGGAHVTDVTNASRTLLMDLRTLDWDDAALQAMNIPRSVLPRIMPSSIPAPGYGATRPDGPFGAAVPITGDLGDQQAALVGQACFAPGDSKNTYGTGCFMLLNTGEQIVRSTCGLLTTVAYQLHGERPRYALEGSIAVTGALVQWLRDNMKFFASAPEIEPLAASVPDNGGVYIVPAFSGLFAPHWRADARGTIVGLTGYSTRAHLARAALEATAYQTRDVLEAMRCDAGVALSTLRVDGGMTANALLMQFQADVLGVPVVRSAIPETTALGAAYAAGLAVGAWGGIDDLRAKWRADRIWQPRMDDAARDRLYQTWLRAVERSVGWVESPR